MNLLKLIKKIPMIYHLEQQKIECAEQSILKALTEGIKAFEPGLLAKNRGLLYVDEVNLLDDHLVDILLLQLRVGIL
jgi:hypothetical protein